MFEKVSPSHPDKVADRIAGAIVDLAYKQQQNPKVACEVLIGHNHCTIINETSCKIALNDVRAIVSRICGENIDVQYIEVPQDQHLAENQSSEVRCGDNGIFKGCPTTFEEKLLTDFAREFYRVKRYDGKFIYDRATEMLTVCQSNCEQHEMPRFPRKVKINFNPLGYWTGGIYVDSGATNRKLGSDMARSVTGGGLHGKDLSKADVSVNIFVFLKAQELRKTITCCCSIGDDSIVVDNETYKYSYIVKTARKYINSIGGFEKFAEWGLVR